MYCNVGMCSCNKSVSETGSSTMYVLYNGHELWVAIERMKSCEYELWEWDSYTGLKGLLTVIRWGAHQSGKALASEAILWALGAVQWCLLIRDIPLGSGPAGELKNLSVNLGTSITQFFFF